MMPGSGSNSGAAAGLILNKMPSSSHHSGSSSSTTIDSHPLGGGGGNNSKRTTLLSLKQLSSGGKSNSLLLAPSARDGFYGPVSGGMDRTESDSDTSSFYHEPYQQRPVISNGTFQHQQQRMLHQQRGYPASSPADPEYGCLIQKEPLVLTPKGLHSNGLYHKQQSKSAGNTLASNNGYANTQQQPPYSSIKSFFMSTGSMATGAAAAAAVASQQQPENYYATTDIIHANERRNLLKPTPTEHQEEEGSNAATAGQLSNYKLACFLAGQPPPPPPPRNLLQSHPPGQPFPSSLSPYVVPATSPVDGDICPPDVSRSHIRLIEKLGEGTFGALHLAELDASHAIGDFNGQRNRLVLLRLIRTNRNGNKATENK